MDSLLGLLKCKLLLAILILIMVQLPNYSFKTRLHQRQNLINQLEERVSINQFATALSSLNKKIKNNN